MDTEQFVWSRYQTIHDICLKPVHAVVNLVGAPETHQELKQIIQTGLETDIIAPKNKPALSNYCRPIYHVQSFDLPAENPKVSQRANNASQMGSNEIGYLTQNFFSSFSKNKPAVTVFVFDWRNEKNFDWNVQQGMVILQIRGHSEKWQSNQSVTSKYMLIFLLPSEGVDAAECRASLKKATASDDYIKSYNYFLTSGFESLKGSNSKKFSGDLNKLVISYYHDAKEIVKKKQKRLIYGQIQHVRYGMKSALYSLITSSDYNKSILRLQEAYKTLKGSGQGGSKQTQDERRENADIIAILILRCYISSGQLQKFLEFFREHFFSYQGVNKECLKLKFEEMKWRANWHRIVAYLLEDYYKLAGGLSFKSKDNWHTKDSQELFPGYYHFQCMMQLIARKQEVERIRRIEEPYMPDMIQTLCPQSSNLIGKEMSFYDINDPLGAKKTFSSAQFAEVITAFKIHAEGLVDLTDFIVSCGHKAVGYYKQRSQVLRGPSGALHTRTVHLINYHLTELMKDKDQPFMTNKDKQKNRKQIAESLIREGYLSEAKFMVERAKEDSQTLEEHFNSEMHILTYDKRMTRHKRHKRFHQLLDKVMNQNADSSQLVLPGPQQSTGKPMLKGLFAGTQLVWARAVFHQESVQVNQFNKLTFEIYSKMSQPLKIAALTLKLNLKKLDVKYDFTTDESLETQKQPFLLSKSNPIKFSRDFYVEEGMESNDMFEFVMLNEINLELASTIKEDSSEGTSNGLDLKFSLSPYLAPIEVVTGEPTLKKRLPPPILYKVDSLPQKIDLHVESVGPSEQALIGDTYKLKFQVKPHTDILLKTVSARVIEVVQNSQDKVASHGLEQDTTLANSIMYPDDMNTPATRQNMRASNFDFDESTQMSQSLITIDSSLKDVNFFGIDQQAGVHVIKTQVDQTSLFGEIEQNQSDNNQPKSEDLLQNPSELGYQVQCSADESSSVKFAKRDADGQFEQYPLALQAEKDYFFFETHVQLYNESPSNQIHLAFDYQFTQNQGLGAEEAVHYKTLDKVVELKSQSPFNIDFVVLCENPFLKSMKKFIMSLFQNDQNVNSYVWDSVQAQAILGNMICAYNEKAWLQVKLTSQSQRQVKLNLVDLKINPEYEEFLTLTQSVANLSDSPEECVTLKQGESYECLFELSLAEKPKDLDVIFDVTDNLNSVPQLIPSINKKDNPIKQMQSYFKVDDISSFAELQFKFQSVDVSNDQEIENEEIHCCVASPHISLIDVPLVIKAVHKKRVRQYEPFVVEYQITNVSERAIQAVAKLLTPQKAGNGSQRSNQSSMQPISSAQQTYGGTVGDFMVSGELKSFVNLMPFSDTVYTLSYTMVPLKLGVLSLPSLTLEDTLQEFMPTNAPKLSKVDSAGKAKKPLAPGASPAEEVEYRCLIDMFSSQVHVTSA